jgi:hypothetical protein
MKVSSLKKIGDAPVPAQKTTDFCADTEHNQTIDKNYLPKGTNTLRLPIRSPIVRGD